MAAVGPVPGDEAQSLREARTRYFAASGFPPDGGYSARWVKVALGPLPFFFPNTAARVRAVRFHDLHHVVTGYATDLVGEGEIAAWEVASGCAGFAAAWVLNLQAMGLGLVRAPAPTWRAFVRGRHTRNLYRRRLDDALLDASVGALRGELGLAAAPAAATPADALAFAGWAGASLCVFAATAALLTAPLWLGLRALLLSL